MSSDQTSPTARNPEKEEDWNDEDDEEEDEEDEDSIWNDLKSGWKQHLLAIIVALLAATMGYFHLQTTEQVVEKVTDLVVVMKHPHVVDYQRMSNVSFCQADHLGDGFMDFSLSSLSVLERLYQADVEEDDEYSKDPWTTMQQQQQHDELDCARRFDGKKITGYSYVYKTPSIESMTRNGGGDAQQQAASLSFTGFSAKFINLSPTPKLLYWDGRGGSEASRKLIAEIPPMESVGTATTPGSSFSITPVYDSSHHLQRWTLTADEAIVVYMDPKLQEVSLSPDLRLKYQMQQTNLEYARDYLVATGRMWLSNFPRPPPLHNMWAADYFGQIHRVVVTAAARHHYIDDNNNEKMSGNDDDLQLQLKAVSVAPRVFEIDGFLSDDECQALIHMAQEKGLHPSTVVGKNGVDKKTRRSETTWLSRESDQLVDTLYRRAADVLQIDESLLRHHKSNNLDERQPHHHSIAEDLQVVHYRKGGEYTPHHDWVHPSIANRHQPTRFATLLLYLKAPPQGGGGETFFPRSIQTNHHDGLVIQPKRGKAVLFYNILPDGNVDDLSQHGSHPVVEGEKWLANLWVWDPIIG